MKISGLALIVTACVLPLAARMLQKNGISALARLLITLATVQCRADIFLVKCHNAQYTGHCNGFKSEPQCLSLKTFEIDADRNTAIENEYGVEGYHSQQRYHDGHFRPSNVSETKVTTHVRVNEGNYPVDVPNP